jgi:RNA polymerase sigma-70 factor (ECF subfamily)
MTEQSQTEAWIAAAQRGDRLALTKLLAACHPRLRARAADRMGAALRARSSPDDILQQVYLDAVRHIDRFEQRGPDSFLNWLYVILNHKIVDAHRAIHCEARDVDRELLPEVGAGSSHGRLLEHVYTHSGTPSRVVRRQEALSALVACLAELSDTHRQIIQLRFLEGLSVRNVAKRLGKSEAAVVALTKRALDALRRAMDRLGEFTRGP